MVVFSVRQRNGSLEEETEVETDVIINFRIACYLHINIELVFFLTSPGSLYQVCLVTVLAACSFLVVANSPSNAVTYAGVVCASLSSGLGEVLLDKVQRYAFLK